MRDSEEHAKLKRKAKKFLKSLGFEEIIEEYRTGVRYSDYYFIMNREALVDVVSARAHDI